MERKPYLTKSRFVAGMNCKKHLWLGWHHPSPYNKPEIGSPAATGAAVGVYAHKLFPNGVLVDAEPWELEKAISKTQTLMATPGVTAIFEAAFEHNGVRIRVDCLERLPLGNWGLREVKSSTSIKPTYITDMAVQYYVLCGCDVSISSIELIHINKDYLHLGGDVVWSKLFRRVNCVEDVLDRVPYVNEEVASLINVLKEKEPNIGIGEQCSTNCDYWDYCTRDFPKDDWVRDLPRLGAKKYNQLEKMGVAQIRDIPNDFPLTAIQETIRQAWITGEDYISAELESVLAQFAPPAYYLDFETMAPAVPIYANTHPYQRQPFQWSLHLDNGLSDLKHFEFLGDALTDPRRSFTESLITACGDNELPIIVYSSFERGVINEMAALFPDLEFPLMRIIDRLQDLLPVTRNHTYFRDYGGSFSIKAVGPTLAPNVNYKALNLVNNGSAASATFALICDGTIWAPDEVQGYRTALLEYCKLDTLAMVEIHRALLKLI